MVESKDAESQGIWRRWRARPMKWPAQVRPRDFVLQRSFGIAAAAYLGVLLLVFVRIFTGDSLHAGAQNNMAPPFVTPAAVEALPYVNVWDSDFVEQFSLFEEYQYRAAREGRFPTWNPAIFCGQAFHGDGQSAMLNPFHWIYFWVDPNVARGPMTVLRFWISAMAMFCLLRRHCLIPTAAFVGGGIWIFSSFNMHWMLWPHSNAALSLPLLLLGLDYVLLRPTWRGYAWASMVIAPLFLAGHPGTEFLSLTVVGVYVALRLGGLWIAGFSLRLIAGRAAAAGAALGTGLLASAAATLPLLMQIMHSSEYLDAASKRGGIAALPWNSLWLFIAPEYFGRPRGAFPGFSYSGPENYIEMSLWFGAGAMVLVVAATLAVLLPRWGRGAGKWRDRFGFLPLFGLVVFAISLLIVFRITPFFDAYSALPMSGLTSPRRLLLATHFAGAILAACGTQRLLADRERTMASLAGVFAIGTTGAVFAGVLLRWDEQQANWPKMLQVVVKQTGDYWPNLLFPMIEQFALFRMVAGLILIALTTCLLLTIVVATWRRRAVSPTLRYGFAAMLLFDAALPAVGFHPVTPLRIAVPPTPAALTQLIEQTGDARMMGVGSLLYPNMSMHYGYRDVRGYDLPHNQRVALLYRKLQIDANDNRGILDFDRFYPTIAPQVAMYLDRTCVRNILLYHPDPNAPAVLTGLSLGRERQSPGFINWVQTATLGGGLMVFMNPNAYPRAYIAAAATPVKSADEAMIAFLNPEVDLRDQSVYESPEMAPPAATQPQPNRAPAQQLMVDKPEQVIIAADSPEGGLLVLADRMEQGWTVTIDHSPAQPVTANYLFRGVFVPAGAHHVEWTYHAPGLYWGVVVSGGTVALLVSVLIWACVSCWRASRSDRVINHG